MHPRYLFGAIDPSTYEAYKEKNRSRYRLSYKAMSEMMISNSLVRVKDSPPYPKELEGPVLLNSLARASYDPKTGSYAFTKKLAAKPNLNTANAAAVSQALSSKEAVSGVGVDQGKHTVHHAERSLLITLQQSSSPPCRQGTQRSWLATSRMPRSLTASRSPHPLRHSLLDGLARKPSSRPSASRPRVPQRQ